MGDSQFIAKDLIVDDPSKDDFKIHGSVYVDPEIFEAEIDKIFHRSWLYLAHESQIAHPNDYLTAYLGREPVILCRGDRGKIRCFLNRCRHRGTLICRSWQGNSSRFRCIFHGWSYRNDGTLIGVPGRQGYPDDFEMDELGLVEVPRIGTYKGFIFASLTQDVPSLSDHLGNTKHFIDLLVDRYPEGIEIAKGAHRYSIRSNWKLQAESELDFYHGPFLHKGFFDAIGEKEALRLDLRDKIFAIYLGRGHAIDVHHKGSDYYGLSIPLASDEELEKRLGPIGSKWSKEIIGFHMFVFPNLI